LSFFLKDESTSLHVLIRNILERTNDSLSLEEALSVLRGVSVGFFSLARLAALFAYLHLLAGMRTHHLVNGSDSELRDALKEALQRVRHDLNLVPPIQ
jgi:hypothetical protein